ncbi:MAG TPA: PqqD family peptide modification chaperone [Candidatus Nitrosotalea sp.]|nr:PqqD family peptide modification chaperone [Candidatus Nitrosotalea sp.]
MAAVTSQQILDSLKQCMDPEIPISVVDMGLIYGVNITPDNKVDITMTMTTRGCPLHDTLVSDVKRYVTKVPGVSAVDVQIVWEPAWTPEKMSDEGKKMINYGKQKTVAPINYEIAMPQGVGSLVKQEDGSLILMDEKQQGFMVNQAIVEFWKLCNGQRRITELVDLFAKQVGMQRGQMEKEVLQLIQQLRDGGLIIIKEPEVSNVQFRK